MGKTYIRFLWAITLLFCSGSGTAVDVTTSYKTCSDSTEEFRDGGRSLLLQSIRNSDGTESSFSSDGVSVHRRSFNFNGVVESSDKVSDNVTRYSGRFPIQIGTQRVSKYISYKEATHSPYAISHRIPNVPNEAQFKLLVNLGVNFFDKLREHFGVPLYINSFFRSKELNTRIGGAFYSDHMASGNSAGIDVDMDGKGKPSNNELFHYAKENMQFYKMIAEFPINGRPAWIHFSYSSSSIKNREKNIFIAVLKNNRKVYLPYFGNEHLIK